MSTPEKHEPSAMTVDLEAGCIPRSPVDSDKPLMDEKEVPVIPDSQVGQSQPCCVLCSPNPVPAILIYMILTLLLWLGHSPFERDVQFPDSTKALLCVGITSIWVLKFGTLVWGEGRYEHEEILKMRRLRWLITGCLICPIAALGFYHICHILFPSLVPFR
ncbi:hypothetical protein V8F33_012682 [Rhypophila sp. PSN 637]